jgi:hypothetical protein
MYRIYIKILSGLFILYFFRGIPILAQINSADGSVIISDHIGEEVASNDEETDPAEVADDMFYYLDNPLNLNTANSEDLRQLHLLTEFQIYSLINYISENGELLSVYELKLLYGFDQELINQLLPFITLTFQNNTGMKQTKNHLKQTLIMRTGLDGDKKIGFTLDTAGIKSFTGANRALLLRYEAGFSFLKAGFTMAQDAGESFTVDGSFFRPDFTSAFLEYNGKGIIKKIIAGDYKASWGQGLVLGGYGSRKGSQVLLSPETTGIKKYSSAGENNFFRGIAGSLEYRRIGLEIFASHRSIDATLHDVPGDSSALPFFNSPDASGLHRSIKELEKKDAVTNNCFGAHVRYRSGNLLYGLSYLNQQYSNDWIRNTTAYTSEIFPNSKAIQNIGTDFKASLGRYAFFGEIAADTKLRLAVFTGILAELHPLVRLSLAYRYYQPEYLGINSSGFGDSQGTKNEEGFYLGLQMYPWKFMKVDIYADNYSFPFLRYNSTCPYAGNDYLLNLTFYPNRQFTISARFRFEKNQNRSSSCITGIDRMETARKGGSRLELSYQLNKNIKLKSRIEFSYFQSGQEALTKGFYSGHDVNIISASQKYKLWFRYAIFDIPRWENRIYAYENDVLYSFSVPAFNSQGTRFIIMGKAELLPSLELSLRYSVSGFRGIKTRGTGNDLVQAGNDSYLTIQIKFKI